MCIVCSIHYMDYRGRITSRLHSEYVYVEPRRAQTPRHAPFFPSLFRSIFTRCTPNGGQLVRSRSLFIGKTNNNNTVVTWLLHSNEYIFVVFCFSWLMIEIRSFSLYCAMSANASRLKVACVAAVIGSRLGNVPLSLATCTVFCHSSFILV